MLLLFPLFSLLIVLERCVQASASWERDRPLSEYAVFRHSMLRLYFRYRVYHAVFCTTHSPTICCFTGATILLQRCICRERAHAEASESRYIRLRGRGTTSRDVEDRKSILWEKDTRLGARPLVDRPIYRRALAPRERRPKLADRVWCLGRVNGPTAIGSTRARLIIGWGKESKREGAREEERFASSVVYRILVIIYMGKRFLDNVKWETQKIIIALNDACKC